MPSLVLLLDQDSQLCKGKGLPWLATSKVSVPDDLSACLFGRVQGGIAHDRTASHGHSPQGLLSIWLYLRKPPLCPQTQEDSDQTFNMWLLRDSQDSHHWDKKSEVWRDKTMCLWFVIPTSHPKRVLVFLET